MKSREALRQTSGDEILEATAASVKALGSTTFYDRMLDLIGLLVRHDLAALVRYSRSSVPDLVLPRIEPTQPMRDYVKSYYAFDPFYQYWMEGGTPKVLRLRSMSPNLMRTAYAKEFLARMEISDEIAIFMPALGDATPTLILDRKEGTFTSSEVERCRSYYPLLASLHQAHAEQFVAEGLDHRASPYGARRPVRILDRYGKQLFATRAWELAVADPMIAQALGEIEARGPCSLGLPGGRTLRRIVMPSDFGAAPSGHCDEIIPSEDSTAKPGTLPKELVDQLTDREQEVVILTLKGYPVSGIARSIGISVGTVRNYRLSIYRKLDITTERELFTTYLSYFPGMSPLT